MKITLSILCLLIVLCPWHKALAQGENNIWTFGEYQGLNFNAGPPPTLYFDSLFTQRACASVCDAAGNMLFYSHGAKVWDKNNHRMTNGNSLNGNTGATQGVAIAQSIANYDQYYVFTIASTGKLYYSVVDMTLNFGLGDVVAAQKNILIDSLLSEKMIVVKGIHYNWLVVHEKSANKFHTIKIDNTGLSAPVISVSGFYNANNAYQVGEMKVSPDNNMLALVNSNHSVELHSFDNVEGGVYNPIKLDSLQGTLYGCSFSPDGSKLYVGKNGGNNGEFLYQYSLAGLPNVAAVVATKTNLATTAVGGMRISPDGKIYTTNPYAYMSVIDKPNLAGIACDYQYHLWGPVIKGNAFETGLGNPFVPYCVPTEASNDTTACLSAGPVTISAPSGYTYYKWNDSTTLQTNTFTTAGTKWVYAYNGCSLFIDTFKVHAAPLDTSAATTMKDTTVCFENNIPLFTASPGYTTYLWSDGFTIQTDSFSAPGTKWVYGQTGCNIHIDSFKVHAGYDTTWVTKDTSLCVAYIPRVIAAQSGFTNYLWSDGTTTQTDTFFASTTKWVHAQNVCNLLLETVNFTATNIPQDSLFTHTTDSVICFEATPAITLSGPAGYTDYLWNDGNPTILNTFNAPGTKILYAQKGCLALVDTFSVFNMLTDTTTHYTDTDVCFEKQVTLNAISGYLSYLWDDGTTGPVNVITDNSTNWVVMHKACADRIDTFKVRLLYDLSVKLANDTAMCKGDLIKLDATSTYADAQYKWQDNSTEPTYNATKGGTYSVTVSVGTCSVSDTMRIQNKIIELDLGDGKVPCGTDELVLDAGAKHGTYAWQDGSTEQTFTVRTGGDYSVRVTEGTCNATASIHVTFEGCPCIFYIPNAFSPNKDGRNDLFGPSISCPVSGFQFVIYNRWGNKIFYTENSKQRWDGTYNGTLQDDNQFYYYCQFKDEGGHNYYFKGDVTVVK